MLPIYVIQALFQSGALQKFHSLSNLNQNEQKPHNPATSLLKILPLKHEMIENKLEHKHSHQMDTVELTSKDSTEILQQQITFQEQGNDNILLRMFGRKKNGKIDPEFCHIHISLNLKHINEVLIDVKVQNRILSIVIFNQTEGIESLVKELNSTLKTNLESLGYHLSTVRVSRQRTSDEKKGQTVFSNVHERVDIQI